MRKHLTTVSSHWNWNWTEQNWIRAHGVTMPLGEFDNAIRMQKRALKFMPHSPPLLRQLDEIEAAKAKATSAANETGR